MCATRLYVAAAVIVLIATRCAPESEIPFSFDLEASLGDSSRPYVNAINGALHGDTAALHAFLLVEYVQGGHGIEHGDIAIALLKKIGDRKFAAGVKRLGDQQRHNLASYFMSGFDVQPDAYDVIMGNPLTFGLLFPAINPAYYAPDRK